MARILRILDWIVRRDWRGLLGRVLRLAWIVVRVAGRWVLMVTRGLLRGSLALADWALRRPRQAFGAGSALVLFFGVALAVFWPGSVPRIDLNQSLDCLALNIYHEARGESLDGQVAVAQVVMNRVDDAEFPDRVCEVVREGGERPRDRCQFSWWCDGRVDKPDDLVAWTGSKDLARRILAGSVDDPTSGALWYHADHVSPAWDMDIIRQAKIGRHVFYRRK
ncbi:MAG: cell wall hydrolase [Alphaproteobacteria bacterium]